MQEQRDLVEQALRRARALDDDRARILQQRRLFIAGEVAAGVDDDRRERADVLAGHALEQLVTVHVRQLEVDDHAVEHRRAQVLERLFAELDRGDFHVLVLDQLRHARTLQRVVLDQQDAFDLLHQLGLQPAEYLLEVLAGGGFQCIAHRAHLQRGFLAILDRHHVHRDVSREGAFLEPLEHRQPRVVRQAHVEQDGIGAVLQRRIEAFVGVLRDQAAILQLMGQLAQDAGELRLVLDHQHHALLERHDVAVVDDRRRLCLRAFAQPRRGRRGRSRNPVRLLRQRRRQHGRLLLFGRFAVGFWHKQGEDAAGARLAAHLERAAQQLRQLAGNRQPQAGATVTAIGRAVGLAKRLEHHRLLVQRNADTRIAHREGDLPAVVAPNAQPHRTLFGELERVGQEVAQDLLDALTVGEQAGRRLVVDLHVEMQRFFLRLGVEQVLQTLEHPRQVQQFGMDVELAGLDLGDVEDVVDQGQQVVAGRIDGAGELHLVVAEVAVGVVRQQLGEDQRAVERRAQLVGHVRQEFRLVATGPLQILGMGFEQQLRFAQAIVLLIHFVALAGQLQRLLGQLFVGLLQLGLLLLHVHLRFAQGVGLFFELLVGGTQLFLLNLQLFVELLGFAEYTL